MRSMINAGGKIATMVVGFALLALPAANGQDTAPKNSTDKTATAPQSVSETKKHEKKISLSDVSTVSTEEATRSAAHQAATKHSTEQQSKSSDVSNVDSVLEFKPAPPDDESTKKSEPGITTKHTRKNIHGEAYGSLDPAHSGNHQTGGAVGAGSKSGKTHVYVETDQSRITTPQ
jgi:hypothetical protein